MICNVAGILIFFCLFGIVVSNPAVDCRKFVFAPLCRGVAAKRDIYLQHKPDTFLNEESTGQFLRNLYAAIPKEYEPNNKSPLTQKEDDEDNIEKANQSEQMNRLLKLLLVRNRKSEKDNVFGQEFENNSQLDQSSF